MRFPVYPERHRRYGRCMLRIRYMLLALLAIGPVLFIIGLEMAPQNYFMMLLGTALSAIGGMFFTTFHAPNALATVEIWEDGIGILDAKGNVYRQVDYAQVRNIEVRPLKVTLISSEQCRRRYLPSSGVETNVIIVYTGSACSFEDLKIKPLGSEARKLYWCDAIFRHLNCLAFVYDDSAWDLLKKYVDGMKCR